MALEGKHEFILYTKDGKKYVFNHKIDAMDALATGHLFEEVPREERREEPVDEAPKKRGRGRPKGITMKDIDERKSMLEEKDAFSDDDDDDDDDD